MRIIFFIIIVMTFGCSSMQLTGVECISGDCTNGQGTSMNKDGTEYVGNFKDGKYDGQGTLIYRSGTKYVGNFKDYLYEGQGTLMNKDGSKYVGNFKVNQYNGQGTLMNTDGTKYVGNFKDNQFEGQGILINADGSKYDGNFKEGQYEGQGIMVYPNGSNYVGNFKAGKRNGQGVLTNANGSKDIGEWEDDKFNYPNPLNIVKLIKALDLEVEHLKYDKDNKPIKAKKAKQESSSILNSLFTEGTIIKANKGYYFVRSTSTPEHFTLSFKKDNWNIKLEFSAHKTYTPILKKLEDANHFIGSIQIAKGNVKSFANYCGNGTYSISYDNSILWRVQYPDDEVTISIIVCCKLLSITPLD